MNDLRYLSLYRSQCENSDFTHANMAFSILSESYFRHSTFTGANLTNANLNLMSLDAGDMSKTDLRYASCRRLKANLTSFVEARLDNADFHQAEFIDCDWRGVDRTSVRPIEEKRVAAEKWQPHL